MLVGLLLALNSVVCVLLIVVVLLQRSEGGALGGGGSPTGLVTTRGAGDLLTRTTWVLFATFLTLSLALTLLGGRERSSQAILNRLKLQSVNPDALVTKPASAPASTNDAPPPVQTGSAAPKPSIQLPGSTPSAAAAFATPTPAVSLPAAQGARPPAKP